MFRRFYSYRLHYKRKCTIENDVIRFTPNHGLRPVTVVTKHASSSCEGIFLLVVVDRRQVKFVRVDVNQLIKSKEENDLKNCLLALRFCWYRRLFWRLKWDSFKDASYVTGWLNKTKILPLRYLKCSTRKPLSSRRSDTLIQNRNGD